MGHAPTATLSATADRRAYIIRGGAEGRQRLRELADAVRPTTHALFDELCLVPGLRCLDAGCGGGDLTLELARRVAPGGHVLGVDLDEAKLELARAEALDAGVANVEYRLADIAVADVEEQFDRAVVRFLLTHVRDPAAILARVIRTLRPGGVLAVEDIDASAAFCHPPSEALDRFMGLYAATAHARGCDPYVGRRLPELLADAGCEDLRVRIVQPAGVRTSEPHERAGKRLAGLTVLAIADAAIDEGLATAEELARLRVELLALAADERTFLTMPRVVQVWARRPG